MIFRTIGTGDDTQVVNLLKAKKIAQDELNASLAEQASVLETDTLELRKLETAVANGATYEEAFASSIKNASTAAKEHAIQTKGASGSTDVFVSKQRSAQASLRATATASKTASVAMRALSMAMNMIVISLIIKGLELLGSAISNYIHRVEKANEKIEESRSSYEDTKSSIESMNDELKTTQDKIDDLQSKGTLSFTDKAELDNLKAQNDELERSISLEEKKKQNAASQTVNDIKQNKDTLSDDFEESIKNLSEYQKEYEHMQQVGIKGISDKTVTPENYEVTMTAMDKNMDLYEKHVLGNIEKFEKYKEDIINKYNTDDVSQFSQSDKDLYNSIVSQLQEAYKTIYSDSDYNKFVIEPIFNQDKLKGLQDQLLQYFVSGGSTDTSALEKKFGADIITALRNACEKAGIDFDKMIEDMYSNSQSKLDQIAPMIETPNGAEDAKQNQVSKKIRDYIQNDLSEEDRTILLNAEIPDDVKFKTKQDVDNFIDSLNKETNETPILSQEELDKQISDLNSAIDSIQSAYDTLNSAVEEYNTNGGTLSIDTIQSLLSLSDEYLACLQVENGQLSLNADAMAQLAQAKLDDAQATAVTQAMTELQAIANGEAAQSTTNYITGNAALMSSLAQLSGSYDGVAQAAMTAAQAQELSAQISAAASKDKTATQNVMKGLDNKLKLIQATKATISAGNFGKVAKKASTSGSGSKGSGGSSGKSEADKAKEYLDAYMKYMEASLDASKITYQQYVDQVSEKLDDMYHQGKISAKDYFDYVKERLTQQLDIYKAALSAVTSLLEDTIDKIQDDIDSLNDKNDALNQQKDDYDSILSVVDDVYQKEIDKLNEQKDLLQDKIDALNDQNDALDLQYRKEQALYALRKAQEQRTKKVKLNAYYYSNVIYESNYIG